MEARPMAIGAKFKRVPAAFERTVVAERMAACRETMTKFIDVLPDRIDCDQSDGRNFIY
jgi:hypothetical protein